MEDIKRQSVLKDLVEGKITGTEVHQVLGISYVHVSRLKKRFLEGGLEGILRKYPPHPPNQKIPATDIEKIIKLRKKLYYDFNIMHFRDKLQEEHAIDYCYESIRQILVKNNLHTARRKKKVYRQRRRMPRAGLLVQMDSSKHRWIPQVEQDWFLIIMIDDATNEVPVAKFFEKDTTIANMAVIRGFIEKKGLFYALYADRASHFTTTRHQGLHYNVSVEQDDTQIERALDELGIKLISANSPQAKGRVEVTFRLFQDRLIKEMRLAGIKNYNEANKFLEEKFLPYYNAKFTHQAESTYMRIPDNVNLDLIFCIKHIRTVNNDNTIQVYGQTIQIPPNKIHLSFARRKVDVCILEDKGLFVLYNGNIIAKTKLSDDNKIIRKKEEKETLFGSKKYVAASDIFSLNIGKRSYRPADSHPWKKKVLS